MDEATNSPKRLKKGWHTMSTDSIDIRQRVDEYEAKKIRLRNALAEKKEHPDRSWKLLARKWNISDKTIAKYWKSGWSLTIPRPNESKMALKSDDFPAETPWSLKPESFNCPDTELTFAALVALQDPPKAGVAEAVEQCANSSIRVVMVTGDHALTATAIAREVGIIRAPTLNEVAVAAGLESWQEVEPDAAEAVVVTGYELPTLSEDAWETVLDKKQIVFARTSPEQKLEIVERCQARGDIVAVTGDGVNDSPALKRADIGCAMGIMGSDVSKESAVVILMDDNFASIVTGIAQGRLIFENLRKALMYMVSSNSCQLLPFIFFAAFQLPLALSPLLILANPKE